MNMDFTDPILESEARMDELKEIVPDYTEDLNDEGVLINNNTTALDEYLRKLKQVTLYKAHKDKLEELYRQIERDIALAKG